MVSIDESQNACMYPIFTHNSQLQNISFVVALTIYILLALFSMIYAMIMLLRPSISSEIRQIFMKKHIIYALTFIIIWSVILANSVVELLYEFKYLKREDSSSTFSEEDDINYSTSPYGFIHTASIHKRKKKYMKLTYLQTISMIASISSGLITAIVRIWEPYFSFILKQTIKSCYGIPLTEQEIQKNDNQLTDTISQFMNSSLNIELVYIILKGITELCGHNIRNSNNESFIPLDVTFRDKKVFYLDEIEVTSAHRWNLLDTDQSGNANTERDRLIQQEEDNDIVRLKERIRVEELAPKIFSILRDRDDITNEDIISSLSPEFNRNNAFEAGESQGKSGSFFFFCHNRRFI